MTRLVLATSNWTSWPGFGGATWVPMQYLLGLARLGVDAIWVDHLERGADGRPEHDVDDLIARFTATGRDFGFAGRWSVTCDGDAPDHGLSREEVEAWAASADLVLRLSGRALPARSPLLGVPRRAYVDVDPGYTQVWARDVDMGFDQYDTFFTVGLGVGRPGSRIPTLGIPWQPTLPPVVLDLWPAAIDPGCRRFSTVADWWGRQHIRFEGQDYGGKREEFLRFIGVPRAAGQPIEAALDSAGIDPRELALLREHEWVLRDPHVDAGDPHAYRAFIRTSRAEFSVAKTGYVRLATGWVSDRTVCYLASGKPAVVQSTGIDEVLPTGQGLLTFRTPAEAVAGIRAVDADYLAHASAARAIAEAWFDSDRVLRSLLERALA